MGSSLISIASDFPFSVFSVVVRFPFCLEESGAFLTCDKMCVIFHHHKGRVIGYLLYHDDVSGTSNTG